VKKYLYFLFCLFLISGVSAQNSTKRGPTIQQQMTKIRQSTDWNNPAEAKKANEKIHELSRKMMQGSAGPSKTNVLGTEIPDSAESKMQMWNQVMGIGRQGENGDILLADTIRKEIVEEFQDDESPKIENSLFLQESTILCINMSLPSIQRTINQMKNFKSVKILVITCDKASKVNLSGLLKNAAEYPLTDLYIINFKQNVTSIPIEVTKFKNLTTLSLINNGIIGLPSGITALTKLKNLYIDLNPVATLMPSITSLKSLAILGIAKTKIPAGEIASLKKILTNCQILEK